MGFRIFNVIEARVLLAETKADFPQVEPRWIVLDPIRGRIHEGLGDRSKVIASEDGTSVRTIEIDASHYRVTVTYRGEETTHTDLEVITNGGD